jgi:hypothetical protein
MTQPLPEAPALAPGTFKTHRFSSPAGERAYKLYVPRTGHRAALPLVVMLHGCTQSANDFATATRMNRLADMHGFLVVYPEQSAYANMARCWNWFNPPDPPRRLLHRAVERLACLRWPGSRAPPAQLALEAITSLRFGSMKMPWPKMPRAAKLPSA